MSYPIELQPGVGGGNGSHWMSAPPGNSSIPPGLEYLTAIDQILVHQIVELLEAFTGWNTNNKYILKNTLGQQMYYAAEETDTCMRVCCKEGREFTIHILDNNKKEVMRLHRPFKCCGGCCWCANSVSCGHEVTVEAPPGHRIGIVRQVGKISKQWSGFSKELFTLADNFGMRFPLDMDVKTKATLIAALFLIDFMVFEKQNKGKNNHQQ